MKLKKGNHGYIRQQKNTRMIQMFFGVLLIATIFFTGILVFKTKATYFSVAAVLCILPFAQVAVNYIMFAKYKTQPQERYAKLANYLTDATILVSDLIITRKDAVYNFPFLIIHQSNIYAYIELPYDNKKVEDFLRDFLLKGGFSGSKMEVYNDFNLFNKNLDMLKKIRLSPTAKDEQLKKELLRNSL